MTRTTLLGSLQSVLVVDDDEFSREVMLKKLGYWGVTNVLQAHNGRDGIQVLDSMPKPPDFLICDIFMPDMDGIEFVGELAKRKYKGGIVLVTGVNQDMLEIAQDIATYHGLKVLGAFTKPLHHDSLGRALGFSEP